MGGNARELLEARCAAFNPESNLRAFLRELTRRCKIYDGPEIDTENLDKTLADLIKAGFLSKQK